MNLIRNLLAVIGLAAVIAAGFVAPKVLEIKDRFAEFDERAWDTYIDMFDQLLKTGNSAEAMVWKVKVNEGIEFEEIEETMKFVANERNIQNVGELPLYKQVEAMSEGKPYRKVKIYMFCNALTAKRMLAHSDAYSAYLPCRITLVEDNEGTFWLYTLNMDPMIHGGTPLPEALKKEALEVKDIMLDIMNRAASGDF